MSMGNSSGNSKVGMGYSVPATGAMSFHGVGRHLIPEKSSSTSVVKAESKFWYKTRTI